MYSSLSNSPLSPDSNLLSIQSNTFNLVFSQRKRSRTMDNISAQTKHLLSPIDERKNIHKGRKNRVMSPSLKELWSITEVD